MLGELDAAAVRRWCTLAMRGLGRAREEIDALNVYPVPDGDTGTNLFLTMESAGAAVDALFAAAASQSPGNPRAVAHGGTNTTHPTAADHGAAPADQTGPPRPATTGQPRPGVPGLGEAVRALAHGALMGARGNSGVILSQLLRGMAEQFDRELAAAAEHGPPRTGGPALRRALAHAADAAYAAVQRPVEGTMLTVASAAAQACEHTADGLAPVVRAAARGAAQALARTPEQLDVLARAGVVDAGGRGVCVLLDALVAVATGEDPMLTARGDHVPVPVPRRCPGELADHPEGTDDAGEGHRTTSPAYEVIYLLHADDEQVPHLRRRLSALGESLVVVGGEGLWNVHVHADDAGAVVEAGIAAGRPHRIVITHLGAAVAARAQPVTAAGRAVVSVVHGEGLAALFTEAGAHVVQGGPGRRPSTSVLLDAVRRTEAPEVVVLPNDADCTAVAQVAAEQAQATGVRVQVVPTKSAVQGLAALAVHEAGRRFDQDVVGMTAAAGATRYGALALASREAWTMAGVCQAGDVLGLIEDDIAVIGRELSDTGRTVLDRMLAGGGELVTLVTGGGLPDGLVDGLLAHLRATRPEVDTVVYHGGQTLYPLLVGVE